MKKRLTNLIFLFSFVGFNLSGQKTEGSNFPVDSSQILHGTEIENMLHPMDAFTAFTFNKSEWSYNQPIGLSPGWLWWGLSDRITTEIDVQAWLGGVLSFNFRFALIPFENSFGLAYEIMYQYLPRFINQFNEYEYMIVGRRGNHFYHHLNLSYSFIPNSFIHFSLGFSYTEFLRIENANRNDFYGNEYNDLLSPDISISIDYRFNKRTSLHLTSSYGNTFVYMDNIPKKIQSMLGTRYKPFIKSKYDFLNKMQVEFGILYMNFPDAKANVLLPYGYFYWQWRRKE